MNILFTSWSVTVWKQQNHYGEHDNFEKTGATLYKVYLQEIHVALFFYFYFWRIELYPKNSTYCSFCSHQNQL